MPLTDRDTSTDTPPDTASPPGFLTGGGEMGERMRTLDWNETSLGDPRHWPLSLRGAVALLLNSRYPMFLAWGSELAFLYNDGYMPIFGDKHPAALAQPFARAWAEIWDDIRPLIDRALAGEATWSENLPLFMNRRGFPEEVYFTFSYSPVRGDDGAIAGMFCACSETTAEVLSGRRWKTLREVATSTTDARSAADACRLAVEAIAANAADTPFALVYLADGEDSHLRLAAVSGCAADAAFVPETIAVREEAVTQSWPYAATLRKDRRIIRDIDAKAGLSGGPWPEPARAAAVLPLARGDRDCPRGYVIAGVSPRLPLDDNYERYLDLLAGGVASAVANAEAYEAERKRAQALAELDRAKTAFFSNVSHEFRTPLTLMLGPLEDALVEGVGAPAVTRDGLELAHRNARRLLKLVNSLLDFSRIEAGRTQASFEPTNIAELTADLASNFRSACERASLEFRIDCPPISEPVYVDKDMWEKIVLNLLSNAFKFTFKGAIEVSLRETEESAVLRVRDTGVGVPAAELPRLFERFHRVEGTRGRTNEGTGIGLALVRELVNLHGGSIGVESEPGQGTTFAVGIPRGSKHLPKERIESGRTLASTATGVSVYVEEALRWLPDTAKEPAASDEPAAATGATASGVARQTGRVLVADDNTDMRDYVGRLLTEAGLEVETAADGEAALELARRLTPDLVLSDVMMPGLDGFELLRALRAQPGTRSIPVILLSARADEEARLEGFDARADDYLVKPFSARELLARVETQLRMAEIRREGELYFRTIADTAPAMLWITDDTHACTYLSRRWYDFTGQNEANGLGFGWNSAVHPEDRERAAQVFLTAAERREPFAFDYRLRRADGSYRWVIDAGQPRFSESGAFLGYIGAVMDAHERKLVEEALKESDRRKDEFLAMLGHELRNPLAAIRNAAELLALIDHPRLEGVQGALDRQSAHMTRLVDGLLDVSRIARGKIELDRHTLDIRDVIDALLKDRRAELRARGLHVRCDLPVDAVWVSADVVRLNQIFDNVLANAIKFSEPPGEINILLEREQSMAVAYIRDAGVGIRPELLEAIFEPFHQDLQDAARAAGGMGVGLALVRTLVELHGGDVTAHSAGRGNGATFVISLPLAPAPADARATGSDAAAPPRRVLLVEDNADAGEVLKTLLEMRGHGVCIVDNAARAIEHLREHGADIVLCDIGLPGMTGYDFAKAVRGDDTLRDVVLIALTGYGQPEDRKRTAEAGFDEHLTKPVEIASLDEALGRGFKSCARPEKESTK